MSLSAPEVSESLLDPLIVNPGRLSILVTLAGDDAPAVEFVDLRKRTKLTDGNLACHARKLAAGGLIDIDKQIRDGKPVTRYLLTGEGRAALSRHVDGLVARVRPETRRETLEPPAFVHADHHEEEWVD